MEFYLSMKLLGIANGAGAHPLRAGRVPSLSSGSRGMLVFLLDESKLHGVLIFFVKKYDSIVKASNIYYNMLLGSSTVQVTAESLGGLCGDEAYWLLFM